jgi:hypothetical protein
MSVCAADAGQHLPGLVGAVADHEAVTVLIALATNRRCRRPPRPPAPPPDALADDLINQRRQPSAEENPRSVPQLTRDSPSRRHVALRGDRTATVRGSNPARVRHSRTGPVKRPSGIGGETAAGSAASILANRTTSSVRRHRSEARPCGRTERRIWIVSRPRRCSRSVRCSLEIRPSAARRRASRVAGRRAAGASAPWWLSGC